MRLATMVCGGASAEVASWQDGKGGKQVGID